jgi:hypothetical protein
MAAGTRRWKSWREAQIDEIIRAAQKVPGIRRYRFL